MLSRGSFRGRGGNRGGGFNRGGGGGFNRGGKKGGGFLAGANGPPGEIIEAGTVLHACEEELLIRSTLVDKVPYFNGRIFLANKQEIGKVDEILGPINDYSFSVKLNEGFKARSFDPNSTLYIDSQQTLPISRFIVKPAPAEKKKFGVKKDKAFSKIKRGASGPARLSRGSFRGNRGGAGFARGRGRF
ncbi:bifunctional H-ACA RNP complex subunit Gar1-Naf1 [Babesia duncani]|uniref:H/ACA ribonucleoprotein complex subunit n=1 Tax=Babesia duncani TaxID=323732 RepID=A0AAD9PPC7_9APIC|nr:bifunctional H-ACA RNP complex subunit Gar1-Naf1 [Babesia duncani]